MPDPAHHDLPYDVPPEPAGPPEAFEPLAPLGLDDLPPPDFDPGEPAPLPAPTSGWRTRTRPAFDPSQLGPVDPDVLAGLNDEQAQAVRAVAGPLLLVAGPGSGKTSTVTHRIAGLVGAGVEPWRILAVTFTNKAAAELRGRVARLLETGEDDLGGMWVLTFHAACIRLLRTYADAAGLPAGWQVADRGAAAGLLKEAIRAEAGGNIETKELNAALKVAQSVISKAKNRMVVPSAFAVDTDPQVRLHAPIAVRYQQALADAALLDFDDLLVHTARLLAEDEQVRADVTDRFRYVHVDEFQDTNHVQWRIVQLLAGTDRNVCAVGDAAQAIYQWRGASPAVLDAFTDHFHEATVITLGRNYRSTQAIVAVANAVLDRIPLRTKATLTTDNPPGDPAELVECRDEWDEARHVVARIRASGDPLSDHAILMRTNAQSRVFEEVLADASITDYCLVGTVRFFDRAEVLDALAWLRLAANGADVTAFRRAVAAPRRGVGPKTADAVVAHADATGLDLPAAARTAVGGKAGQALAQFADVVEQIRVAAETSLVDAVKAAVVDSGLRRDLLGRVAKDPAAADRLDNLDQLVDTAARFERRHRRAAADPDQALATGPLGTLHTWLESTALESAADASESGLKILTAHAAKGREFKHVYVVGCEDGFYPHTLSDDDASRLEERRLLFVAVSRAEQHLTLSWCGNRSVFGASQARDRSPFLDELAATPHLAHKKTAAARQRAGQRRSRHHGHGYGQRSGSWQRRR